MPGAVCVLVLGTVRRSDAGMWAACVVGSSSVVRTAAALGRRAAVEGKAHSALVGAEESEPPASGNLEGPLLLLWDWPGEKRDTCPREGALEVTG